jgi:signal transduction histidine kinase
MGGSMSRHRTLVTYLVSALVALGTAIRYLAMLRGDPRFGWVAGLLAAYLLLLALEPRLSRRSCRCTHLYLAAQTGIASALALLPPQLDYFSILFIPLVLQAVHVLRPRASFCWIGVFTVVMAALMFYGQEFGKALALVLIFVVLYWFFGSYAIVVRQAEAARQESQALLDELQAVHRQLQSYTVQVQELAVERERGRLGRDLHDSVTQTLFTMTLTVESTRLLFARDLDRAKQQLGKLQALARSALGEMRALIYQLRPSGVAEHGLVAALRHHLVLLQREQSLSVAFQVSGESPLRPEQAQRLFRIAQEALNNVVKHAETDQAEVTLRFEGGHTLLKVRDQGKGFVPGAVGTEGTHIGLSTMRERAEQLGGSLIVDSRPGGGTCVVVEIPAPGRDPDLGSAGEQG